MKVLILMGSPRLSGNTAELCKPFIQELNKQGAEVKYIELEKLNIGACKGCYKCQNNAEGYGCVQEDDMYKVVEEIVWGDCIILATPIYAWYCAAKMKAVLDRHYGLNKYYGNCEGSLWVGKKVGIIATHGYKGAYATDPFETGVKRLCKHSDLRYIGMYSVQDTDNKASFQTEEAIEGTKAFAQIVACPKADMRIEDHKSFKVCGKKVWISGQDNSQFEKFWSEAHRSGMVQELKAATNPAKNVTKSDILGVSCVEKDPANRAFDFYIASECSGQENYEEYVVPAGTWAIFRGKGKLPESLVNAEMYAFMEWLPGSGYEHALAPELEVYLAGESDTVEFWLPITRV